MATTIVNLQPNLATVALTSRVVFIDSAVTDIETLKAGVIEGAEAVILRGDRDGVEQITEYLRQNPQVAIADIVSHGSPGCLYLGNGSLNLGNLAVYRELLQSWREGMQILLYGCHVAAGDAGEEFIAKLEEWTGGKVAASMGKVGNAALGGSWSINHLTETQRHIPLAFKRSSIIAYQEILALNLISSFAPIQAIHNLDIVENYLYFVGDQFRILDISNPLNPSYLGNITLSNDLPPSYINPSSEVKVVGNYAYIAHYK
jgi:hypothetical protein